MEIMEKISKKDGGKYFFIENGGRIVASKIGREYIDSFIQNPESVTMNESKGGWFWISGFSDGTKLPTTNTATNGENKTEIKYQIHQLVDKL